MKKSKIVILRGKVACGKTTTLYRLKKNSKMKNWVFIDNSELKRQFENLGDEKRKELGKEALFSILKIVMPTKKNILMDEMVEKSLKKNLGYYIRKYNYEIITFQFEASLNNSVKREAKRRRLKRMKPRGKEWVKKYHEWHEKRIDPKRIIVDTNSLNEREVEKFILQNLKI